MSLPLHAHRDASVRRVSTAPDAPLCADDLLSCGRAGEHGAGASAAAPGAAHLPVLSRPSHRTYARVQQGDRIAGRYVVERILGRGGIGVVVAAEHILLKQRVALKFLRTEYARDPEVAQRLVREARALAQLRSPHVARVLDCGLLETGEPFLAMELLEGDDLGAILARNGPLSIRAAARLVTHACEGLAEAHGLGIVHRDIKPANLFVARSPEGGWVLKVVDFGLSKLAQDFEPAITGSRHVLGSPHFISPEQLRCSRDVDSRTDIWALGAVLYTCLAGRRPFEGKALPDLFSAILTSDIPPIRERRPDVSQALEEVVRRCAHRDPDARFQTASELALALAPFAGERTRACTPTPYSLDRARTFTPKRRTAAGGRGGVTRTRVAALAVALSSAALCVAIAGQFVKGRLGEATTPAPERAPVAARAEPTASTARADPPLVDVVAAHADPPLVDVRPRTVEASPRPSFRAAPLLTRESARARPQRGLASPDEAGSPAPSRPAPSSTSSAVAAPRESPPPSDRPPTPRMIEGRKVQTEL